MSDTNMDHPSVMDSEETHYDPDEYTAHGVAEGNDYGDDYSLATHLSSLQLGHNRNETDPTDPRGGYFSQHAPLQHTQGSVHSPSSNTGGQNYLRRSNTETSVHTQNSHRHSAYTPYASQATPQSAYSQQVFDHHRYSHYTQHQFQQYPSTQTTPYSPVVSSRHTQVTDCLQTTLPPSLSNPTIRPEAQRRSTFPYRSAGREQSSAEIQRQIPGGPQRIERKPRQRRRDRSGSTSTDTSTNRRSSLSRDSGIRPPIQSRRSSATGYISTSTAPRRNSRRNLGGNMDRLRALAQQHLESSQRNDSILDHEIYQDAESDPEEGLSTTRDRGHYRD